MSDRLAALRAWVEGGGTLVLAGIPADDQLLLTHHVVRRKGATLQVVRRMKLTYPRAIALVVSREGGAGAWLFRIEHQLGAHQRWALQCHLGRLDAARRPVSLTK